MVNGLFPILSDPDLLVFSENNWKFAGLTLLPVGKKGFIGKAGDRFKYRLVLLVTERIQFLNEP